MELQLSWAKRKAVEFDEITRIPDLHYLTDYPKVPQGTVTRDFSRNLPLATPGWQKEHVRRSSTTGKKLEYKSPQPWQSQLPGVSENALPRGTSAQPRPATAVSSGSRRRPASSMGFSQREHSSEWQSMSGSMPRPKTPSAEAMAGVKTVVVPHAIPNLKPGLMPSSLEHWPARTTTLQPTDIFHGEV